MSSSLLDNSIPVAARRKYGLLRSRRYPIKEQAKWPASVRGRFSEARCALTGEVSSPPLVPLPFRIKAGERNAENQLAIRNRMRELSFAFTKLFYGDLPSASFQDLDKGLLQHDAFLQFGDITKLGRQNEMLTKEVSQLRSILSKIGKAKSDREPTPRNATSHAVAELLSLSSIEQAEQIISLTENGTTSIETVVKQVGFEKTVWLSNMLGRSHVAIVHDGKFVCTELGASLGKALKDLQVSGQAAN